jgi:NAD-dependent dihydropyrimidine dehydrogenase PreA subunit
MMMMIHTVTNIFFFFFFFFFFFHTLTHSHKFNSRPKFSCFSQTFTFLGKLCIEVTPKDKMAWISEELCIGCGICVKVRTDSSTALHRTLFSFYRFLDCLEMSF